MVWLKFCLLTLGSVYTIPYHTIPYVVDVFCICSGYPFNAAFISDGRMVQYLGKLIQEAIKYIDLLRCFMGSTFALWDAKVKRVE